MVWEVQGGVHVKSKQRRKWGHLRKGGAEGEAGASLLTVCKRILRPVQVLEGRIVGICGMNRSLFIGHRKKRKRSAVTGVDLSCRVNAGVQVAPPGACGSLAGPVLPLRCKGLQEGLILTSPAWRMFPIRIRKWNLPITRKLTETFRKAGHKLCLNPECSQVGWLPGM